VDTFQIYQRLKRARASEAVSREMAGIFGDLLETRLATKRDIASLDRDLKAEIANSRVETLRWMLGSMAAQTGLLFAAMKLLS